MTYHTIPKCDDCYGQGSEHLCSECIRAIMAEDRIMRMTSNNRPPIKPQDGRSDTDPYLDMGAIPGPMTWEHYERTHRPRPDKYAYRLDLPDPKLKRELDARHGKGMGTETPQDPGNA